MHIGGAHESHDSSNKKQVGVQGEWEEGEGEDPHSAKEWPCSSNEIFLVAWRLSWACMHVANALMYVCMS